jgi:cold shock protein
MAREQGIVKWFDEEKKYGFILPDIGREDIFFHQVDLDTLDQTIEKGERVEYEIGNGPKGREAKHILRIDEGS